MDFEMGSVYKIDHNSKLPRSTTLPSSLNSIKAVMVNKKSDDDVTVVFPSMKSVRNFFGNKKVTGLMQPNLDEQFVMGLNVGKKLLTRKVSFEEFASQRGNRSFWVKDDHHHDHHDEDDDDGGDDDDDDHKEDDRRLSSNDNNGGLELKWRKRRRTTFRRKKTSVLELPSVEKEEDDDEENKDDEEEEEEEKKIPEKTRFLKKRKCHIKGMKYCETKSKKKNVKGVSEKKFKDSQHRWTIERYKLAEKNMLKILKEKGAGPNNPILRPDLRTEARKLIGDTGLLDHLLKHMAGKVAPGGKERFRRRHNPEGAMEYWLESADLIETRKLAGVSDPFWVPPPGWKPGDCPNRDPVCAGQLTELKDEVATMKRELEKLACRGRESDQAALSFEGSIKSLKELHNDLMKKKARIEKQLLEISKNYSEMEEDIGWLKESVADDENQGEQRQLVLGLISVEENRSKKTAAINELPAQTSEHKEDMIMQQQKSQISSVTEAAEDEKEKRRQKLKSGFRICKPQGSFLWPSQMAAAAAAAVASSASSSTSPSQVVVHLEDILGYPTPPSVSSSSCKHPFSLSPPPHDQQLPPSPRVKRPVATRAAVTLNFSIATIRGSTTIDSINSPTSTTATAATGLSSVHNFVPDLNEVPSFA